MNHLTTPMDPTQTAHSPFHFNSAAYLVRIERERASNVGELLLALRECSENSIFQHTFRTLQEHHFIGDGYSNDFSQWSHIGRYEEGLAKDLADVDIQSFTSIEDLRSRIVEVVENYLRREPASRDRPAVKPFCFCSSETVVMPTSFVAHYFQEFANAIKQVSPHSIHYHFIEARLRLKLNTNDFSQWLEEMGLKREAKQLNDLDIYTSTLEDLRGEMLEILHHGAN
jgi:hypothetical protein